MKLFINIQGSNINMENISNYYKLDDLSIIFTFSNGAKKIFTFDSTDDRDNAISSIDDEYTLIL
jgi:hypothetical protein